MSDFIHNVPIKVPNKSGFDMDFENAITGKCGQLIPVVCQEVLPNDTISLGVVSQVQLPPLVSDAIGRIEFVFESFFVPSRLCWKGWSTFMTHPTAAPQYPTGYPDSNKISHVPHFTFNFPGPPPTSSDRDRLHEVISRILGPGSLADFLDQKLDVDEFLSDYFNPGNLGLPVLPPLSVLPFIAYHLIWDTWYRDSRIQAPIFYEPSFYGNNTIVEGNILSYLPSVGNIAFNESGTDNSIAAFQYSGNLDINGPTHFLDGSNVFYLRQRNWAKDYFTSASTQPQASVVGSTVNFDVVEGKGSFSIAALRASNSLQMWLERNNLAGYRYADQIYAQFGIYPADAIMDRPLYLGRHKQYVYNRSVFQQSPTVSDDSRNPFSGNVGAKFGSAQSVDEGSLVDSFTATEHGYLITLASLVPRAYYSQGTHRKLRRLTVGDYAFPILANMGDQMINSTELLGYTYGNDNFGYTDLYAEYKVNNDQIHGLLRDGENLQHFALQRSFDSGLGLDLEINSDFLGIPTNFLDQILAVDTDTIGCTFWADLYFKMKKVSTLPVYSQPTLMDLQNGHVESIPRGGKRL